MNELHLFAGAGGGILGGSLLGWRCVCAVENSKHRQRVLVQRQNDGILEPFPVWDDVRTFHGTPWRGVVDVVSGGFPCQGISVAGKGKGLEDPRSGLWGEMARIIGEVRPRFVFVENSPQLTRNGGARVLSDLAQMGYDAVWGVMGAHHAGAPHKRDRIWVVANADRQRRAGRGICRHGEIRKKEISAPYIPSDRSSKEWQEDGMANADSPRSLQQERPKCDVGRWLVDSSKEGPNVSDTDEDGRGGEGSRAGGNGPAFKDEYTGTPLPDSESQRWATESCLSNAEHAEAGEFGAGDAWGENSERWSPWDPEPILDRVANGVADRVDRVEAIGDGQVPAVVAGIWKILSEEFE